MSGSGDGEGPNESRRKAREMYEEFRRRRSESPPGEEVAPEPEDPEVARELRLILEAEQTVREAFPDASLDGGTDGDEGIRRLGRFELGRLLGSGGFADVFLAWDSRLQRQVAVKVFRAATLGGEAREQFEHEVGAVSELRHPNIVPVYEPGGEDGPPFFVMAFLHGGTWREKGRTFPLRERVRRLERVARAVAYAHSRNVVHLDLKPSNILLDGEGTPYVADFGLALKAGGAGDPSGITGGTLPYMAPERLRGEVPGPDPRMDVFSLGVLLYESLTGRRPFDGPDEEAVRRSILEGRPADARRLSKEVHRDLAAICKKAIFVDPGLRYPSAGEFADDLRAYLEDRPVLARRPSIVGRLWKWARRNKWRAAGVAAGILFMGAAGIRHGISEAYRHVGEEARREFTEIRARLKAAEAETATLLPTLESYLSQAARGRIAAMESEVVDLRLDAIDALARGQEAFESARAWSAPFARASPDFRSDIYALRADLVSSSDEAVVRLAYRKRAIRLDGEGLSSVAGTLGRVRFLPEPPGAEAYLFRYEPYEFMKPGSIPRLVPVPVSGEGVPVDVGARDFVPGDPCLVVLSDPSEGPLRAAGVRRGDLTLRIGRFEAGGGLFVREVLPGSPAHLSGVRPFDRFLEVAGRRIEGPYEWEAIQGPRKAEGNPRPLAFRIAGQDGTERSVEVELWPQEGSPERSNEVALTERWLLGRGVSIEQGAGGRTLEALVGVRTGMPSEVLESAPDRDVSLLCLVSGSPREVRIPAVAKLGAETEATAYPLVFAPGNRIAAGSTLSLAPGSYLALFRAEGFEDLRKPFVVEAESRIDLSPSLLPNGSTPEGFVYVDGGPFVYQGDPHVLGFSQPREVREEPGFLIGRSEVSIGEWFDFVNDPQVRPEAEVDGLVPGTKDGPWSKRQPDGFFPLPAYVYRDSPAVGVSHGTIADFLRWKNRRAQGTGWGYRLPTPEEWEKAARGVDGRFFQWGDRFDYGLANTIFARRPLGEGVTCLEPRGWFPTDESPFGVRDLAGGAAEFNEGDIPAVRWTVIRGGSWVTSLRVYFRAAGRTIPEAALPMYGLRLVAERRQ